MVNAPVDAVEAALGASPRVATRLPTYLRIGFPRPLEAHGAGLAVGDLRTIHFAGAEGDPPGDLVMRVAERAPGYVRFETVSDGSKLTQWVRWESSEVTWKAVDAGPHGGDMADRICRGNWIRHGTLHRGSGRRWRDGGGVFD